MVRLFETSSFMKRISDFRSIWYNWQKKKLNSRVRFEPVSPVLTA